MEPEAGPIEADGLAWAFKFGDSSGPQVWDWRHFDLVNPQARSAVQVDAALPHFARQVLSGTDESPRILTDGHGVAGVIPAYARVDNPEEYNLVCWHFAMVPSLLVTGRRHPNRTLMHAWEIANRGVHPPSPAALINNCITEFAREVRARLSALAEDLDEIEDGLIGNRDAHRLADLGALLGRVRREATRHRRALAPLVRALRDEAEEFPEWAQPAGHDSAERGLNDALDDIIALQDRARALQDELATRLTEETNRRLYIVSIVTTLVMPATFVTGFFGMNTGGLLWGGDGAPHGTLYATAICLFSVLLTLTLLRWKRLL